MNLLEFVFTWLMSTFFWMVSANLDTISTLFPDSNCKIEPQLITQDEKPLAGRTPLILIHGWASECEPQQGWASFLKRFKKEKLNTHFKVYNFVYPSRLLSIENTATKLRELLERSRELRDVKPVFVGHSRGGLVARAYMTLENGGDRVIKLITIATPHHGTPMASLLSMLTRKFGDYNIRREVQSLLPLKDARDKLMLGLGLMVGSTKVDEAVKAASDMHYESFLDMRWDNYDAVVGRAYEKYSESFKEEFTNDFLRKLNQDRRWDNKIIAYYGYVSPQLTFLGDPLAALSELQSGLPGDFAFNDGLVPIRSSAFAEHNVQRRGPFSSISHEDLRSHPQVLKRLMQDLNEIAVEELSQFVSALTSLGCQRDGPVRLCAD